MKASILGLALGLLMPLAARDTKMVLLFARHGARYSDSQSVEPSKRGQQTGNGLRMGYQLGRYMKDKFATFLPKKMDNRRVYVVASGMDRTRQFAQALMLGVYDFGSLNDPIEVDEKYVIPEWKDFSIEDPFKTALPEGYQPVPVHSYYTDDNYVFTAFSPLTCPLTLSRYAAKTDRVTEVNKLSADLLAQIKAQWDYSTVVPELKNYWDLFNLMEYVVAQKYLGTNLISDDLYAKLIVLTSMTSILRYSDPEQLAFATSELNKLILSFLEAAKKGLDDKTETYKNFVVLVGHDVNIFLLYMQLGMATYECLRKRYDGVSPGFCPTLPDFASSFYFEVYAENGAAFADFIVNGEKKRFCSMDDAEKCSLADTITRLKTFTSPLSQEQLLAKYCVPAPEDKNRYLWAMIIFNIVAILFLLYLIITLKRKSSS